MHMLLLDKDHFTLFSYPEEPFLFAKYPGTGQLYQH